MSLRKRSVKFRTKNILVEAYTVEQTLPVATQSPLSGPYHACAHAMPQAESPHSSGKDQAEGARNPYHGRYHQRGWWMQSQAS